MRCRGNWPLDKKAIFEIKDDLAGYVRSFFCVPKIRRVQGHRQPKTSNKFIEYDHFKMDNLGTVRFLVREGNSFIKLDLKDR